MSARRRRRSNSQEDTAAGEYSQPMSENSLKITSSSFTLPPPLLSAGDAGCRDRTQELRSIIMSLRSSQIGGVTASSGPVRPMYRNDFTHIAKKISSDLANTYAKLEKLTVLAKRKSLFDDKGDEIQQLTFVIKQDLGALNKQIAQLQELSKLQLSKTGRHRQSHANSVVVYLQSRLATMSGSFKSVLEVRTENLKLQKTRRDEFSRSAAVSPSMPASVLNGRMGSVLLQDEAKSETHSPVVIDMDGVVDRHNVGHRQRQLQLVDEQDSYIQDRADTMKNIEQTIVELGSIFQQLATMVKEQEEVVQRIDSNVDSTHLNIEAAHSELVKYFQSVTSNRWLMIKIFGVLIVFFIIFVVFFA